MRSVSREFLPDVERYRCFQRVTPPADNSLVSQIPPHLARFVVPDTLLEPLLQYSSVTEYQLLN